MTKGLEEFGSHARTESSGVPTTATTSLAASAIAATTTNNTHQPSPYTTSGNQVGKAYE